MSLPWQVIIRTRLEKNETPEPLLCGSGVSFVSTRVELPANEGFLDDLHEADSVRLFAVGFIDLTGALVVAGRLIQTALRAPAFAVYHNVEVVGVRVVFHSDLLTY